MRRDFVVFAGNVAAIALDGGNNLAAENAGRNVPVGPQNNVGHLAGEDRRLRAHRLPDHDPHIQHNIVVFIESAQPEIGNIHDDRRRGKLGWEPAPTLQGELQLENPILQGHIQLFDRGGTKAPIGIEAVAELEVFNGIDQWTTVDLRVCLEDWGVRRQVADES